MVILISCVAVFAIAILLSILLKSIVGNKSANQIMAAHKTDNQKENIFLKKYPEVNIDRYRTTFGLVGLATTLALILFGFESFAEKDAMNVLKRDLEILEPTKDFIDEKDVPIVLPPPPEVVVPPPPMPEIEVPRIEEVEVEVEKTIIKTPEITKKVSIPVPAAPVVLKNVTTPPPPPPMPAVAVEKDVKAVILNFVEVAPVYPGGDDALRKEVQKAYDVPRSYSASGESGGTIVTRFVVLDSGEIGEVQILKGLEGCSECDEEAVKSIKSLKNRFEPGKQAGKPVKVWFTLPIVIQIRN